MKINQVKNKIESNVVADIKRRYPLIDGTQNGWPQSLDDSRDRLIQREGDYPLMQEPIVECIPKYLRDGSGWVVKLHEDDELSDPEAAEMEEIVETLKSGIFEPWELYPHQKESLKAYLRGKHVMVATGTGSGKTESFMIPMVAHVHRAAQRNKEIGDGTNPARNALKCLVLYPMNALVADQLGRLREIFGHLGMSKHLEDLGLNRNPRFGMYTSRAPFHGWYAREKNGKWDISRNKAALRDIARTHEYLELERPDVWQKMLKKGKIPAKGFRMRPRTQQGVGQPEAHYGANPESVEQIKWAKKHWHKLCRERGEDSMNPDNLVPDLFDDENEDLRWEVMPKRWNLTWFMRRGGTKVSMRHPPATPSPNDREYVLRTEMHQGGLRQFMNEKIHTQNPQGGMEPWRNWHDGNGSIRPEHQAAYDALLDDARSQGGPPDIMVTNYSMLEYMMLRPLEHRFWYETKLWLDESPENKLLFVIDEAHLYEGAVGTEVSMLIQRLRNVIDVPMDKFQFILTSASLGGDEPEIVELKYDFIQTLIGAEITEDTLAMPEGVQVDLVDEVESWEVDADLVRRLAGCRVSEDDHWTDSEKEVVMHLNHQAEPDVPEADWPEDSTAIWRQQVLHDVMSSSDIFRRFYALLNNPDRVEPALDDPQSGPRKLKEISMFLMGGDDDEHLRATETFIELIGDARNHKTTDVNGVIIFPSQEATTSSGNPLLPVRTHLFLRGLPRLSACILCGEVQEYGGLRCCADECSGRVYELLSDRGSGEPYVRIWLPMAQSRPLEQYTQCLLHTEHATSFIQPDESIQIQGGGLGKAQKLLGFSGYRVMHNDERRTHYLHALSGQLVPRERPPAELDDWAAFILPDFEVVDGVVRFRPNSTGKQFHKEDLRLIDFKIDQGTQADHSGSNFPQITDMETRGDDAFSVAINELTDAQDPDLNSTTANQGKKTLIFSDGRQRAAKIAKSLSSMSILDETRRLLYAMIRLPWFRKLEPNHRRINDLYTWITLLGASLRSNAFENKDNREDQLLHVEHQARLCAKMSFFLLEEGCIGVDGFEDLLDVSEEDQRKYGQVASFSTSIRTRLAQYNGELETHPTDQSIKAKIWMLRRIKFHVEDSFLFPTDYDQFMQSIKYHPSYTFYSTENPETCEEEYNGLVEVWINCGQEADTQKGYIEAIFHHIIYARQGSINAVQRLANNIISAFTDMEAEEFTNFLLDYSNEWRFEHENRSWTGILTYHLFEKYFAGESLGLGYLHCLPTERQRFPDAEAEVRSVLPRLFYDQIANDSQITQILQSKRPLRSVMIQDPNSGGKMTYGGIQTQLRRWHLGTGMTYTENPITRIGKWLTYVLPDDSAFSALRPAQQDGLVGEYIGEFSGFVGLKADKVVLLPMDTEQFRICGTCRQVRLTPTSDQSMCPRCGAEGEYKPRRECDENEESYLSQRIDVWNERIEELRREIEEGERATIKIFRTEEHTAQISEKHNRSDVFSTTELHELQFQDIPVISGSNTYKFDLPPIDILSCTTTMEVGIDIGSLTAVALRTVPPHASNYQQRVGRAGRGSSSLSVAITYIDNSSFAMSRFNNPMEIVRNPSAPPQLYNNNKAIMKRHLNASIFQKFSKREAYDPVNLVFGVANEIDGSVSQLMESLGTVGSFFDAESEASVSLVKLVEWMGEELGVLEAGVDAE